MKIGEGLSNPFANYDTVVYFGGALFFIPFLNRYIVEPLNLKYPKFEIDFGSSIASEAVSILSLLFCIYIIGHILAYLGSQVIEKTLDRFFGKVSSAILTSSAATPADRNGAIRKLISTRMSKIIEQKSLLTSIIRFAFHLPVLPIYLSTFLLGFFGYYDTRLTESTLHRVKEKYKVEISSISQVDINEPWFKPLEYYVINRHPAVVPRMYNYLVISGLFRTISLIFLFAIWMSTYFCVHYALSGHWLLKPLFGSQWIHIGVAELLILALMYMFCLFAYLKFQRRYAEEAIFAFIFGK